MGGGFLLNIRDDIPTKFLKHDFGTNIKNLSVEINLRKRKWFFNGSYNPHKSKILNHLDYLNLVFNKCSNVYDNFIFMGDFNVAMSDKAMEDFCSLNNLERLIRKPTCYKNHENPTCIDLILTNRPSYFQHSNVFEAGISDFHLLIVTQLKIGFQKKLPKIITYRDYKKIDNAKFRDDVINFTFDQFDVSNFKETILNIFDKHAPIKQKYFRANEAPFMVKELHKEIMKRSRLRSNFLRTKSQEDRLKYNKQRNFCKKLLRTTKKLYFNNLDIKKVVDNISFWKTVSPLFSTKCSKCDKIILNENDKYVSNDGELCQIFCDYYSNIISELQIPSISENISNVTDITDPVLAAINTFQDHPSIKNIREKSFKSVFSFAHTNEIEI